MQQQAEQRSQTIDDAAVVLQLQIGFDPDFFSWRENTSSACSLSMPASASKGFFNAFTQFRIGVSYGAPTVAQRFVQHHFPGAAERLVHFADRLAVDLIDLGSSAVQQRQTPQCRRAGSGSASSN